MANVICVDGPAASGKSTVSKAVAEKLGYLYVDSGALYRIMTWLALEAGVDTGKPESIAEFARDVDVAFVVKGCRVAYEVGGVEPGDRIRTPEINRHVSPVSAVPEVRERVTGWLRDMRRLGDLIVEGRDIGSVVYPDSPWRFYLDADPEELLQRVAFGTPDVLATVNALRARGVDFVESPTGVHTGTRGALTRADAGSPSFELVLDAR